MHEKESRILVWCELKIPSLRITVRHHSASLAMPDSYPRDSISVCNPQPPKILIIQKMCNGQTFVKLKYEIFFVRTYVTYKCIMAEPLLHTKNMITCNCTFVHMKMCNVHFRISFFSEFGQLHIKMFQKVQERGSVSLVFKIWTSA